MAMNQRKSIEHFVRRIGQDTRKKWYEHVLEGEVRNEEVKVLWDITVQLVSQRDRGEKTRHNCK